MNVASVIGLVLAILGLFIFPLGLGIIALVFGIIGFMVAAGKEEGVGGSIVTIIISIVDIVWYFFVTTGGILYA